MDLPLPPDSALDHAEAQGLYARSLEHDACGVGFVANIKGRASHAIVQQALLILHNLDHRGAIGADPLCGDGAGILVQIPDAFYRDELAKQQITLPPPGEYGVGMIFLPRESASRLACEQELERTVRAEGQVVLGWRDVPVDRDMPMSPLVREREPVIRQIFIGRGPDVMVPDALERKLYVIRKTASHKIQALKLQHGKEYFVPSMSTRTVVYKGLLLADQVGRYYADLRDPRVVSAIALVHQRFSTNTFPVVGTRASVPPDRAQRRDQHRQGQLQLDPRARRRDVLAGAARGPRQALSADLRRTVRHGLLRQRARAAGHERLPARPRDDDDDSRGLGAARADG